MTRYVTTKGGVFIELLRLEPDSFDELKPKNVIGVPVYWVEGGFVEVWPKPLTGLQIFELREVENVK